MLRPSVTLLGLIFALMTTAASQNCVIRSPATVGTVYENAATDTLVKTLDVDGNIDSEIRLELTGEMATYFRLDGKNILVIDSTALDRNSSGLEITGSDSISINGQLSCFIIVSDPNNPASEKKINIQMTYINKKDPKLLGASNVIQNEFTIPSTVIATLTADDGEDTGLPTSITAIKQDPPGYLDVTSSGDVTLIKELDYEDSTSIVVTLEITDEGFDSTGAPLSRTIETEYTVNITDYDDTNPIFTTCNSADCIPPVYTANVSVLTTGQLTVQPQEISAFDGDTAINAAITYSLAGGSPEYDTYFEIDSSTGIVSVKQEIDSEGVFILAVRAQQSDAANRFSIAYLQVDAYVSDESKPVITVTKGDIGNVVAIETGDDIIYVESNGAPIILGVSDEDDDDDSNLLYVTTPNYFQVSSTGEVFAFRDKLFTSTRGSVPLVITAVNIEASTNSPNRISEPITMSVVTFENGTIPDPTTPDGTIIEDLVPRSTLIGVAAGLSSVLFIAICIIVFLLWKLMHKDKKGDDDDNKSQTSSQTHSNDAYTEENETREEEPDEDKGVGTFGFSSAIAAGEMNESGVDMENDQDSSSQGEAVTDFGGGYDFGGNYEPAADPENVETDPVVPIYAEVQRKHEVDEEVEDRPLPTSDFERELLDKANTMAVSAAAAATIAKSVEDSPAPAVAAEFTPNLPPEVVQEESVIKEDDFNSVKIVTLKGYGDDGVDVKAVMKSIDTGMATSVDVNAVRKRISIMEELSEMDHPNILRYYGSYVTDDSINYAVKFAENGNLRDTLRNGTLDSHAMMLMMANIGKGLQYLHAKNVTHGNVWANAIMLDDSNTPMLTDIDGSTEASSEYKDIMRWQAAEVLNQTSGTSPATDVWSFGTLMWEIVSQGATPYEGVPLKELSSTVDREQLKRPKGCSESLFNIMEKCWVKDTRKRPDMYVINSNLSEMLLEDSNEHIRMNDNRGSISSKEDVSDIHNELSDSEDLTAF